MNTTPEGSGARCPGRGVTRRGFLVGAGAGLAVGAPLGWLGLQGWQRLTGRNTPPALSASAPQAAAPRSRFAMPGLFPGRVIEVRHPAAVNDANEINADVVRDMMSCGMCALTGAPRGGSADAWRTFFERDDIVGIKVNPVGKRQAGQGREVVPCISSPAVLLEVVAGLRGAGIPPRNILVFERYANEFREAGYERVMGERALDGVRWFASSSGYDSTQLELTGQNRTRERDPHVVGYDRDVFVSMGFCARDHDRRDDRRFRSHLSAIITRMVSKFVTLPCLKDHRSAGVTLALKNLSHGLNNNVARSHVSGVYTPGGVASGPNQCNTFIPTAVAQRPLLEKATLHIMDGLIGVYEGGPGPWNRSWGTWRHNGLFFATDPVALDMVGWRILDARRLVEGWQPVAQMGLHNRAPQALSPLALNTASALRSALEHLRAREGRASEVFDRRQPEHVLLAGFLGLGEWQPEHIEHRLIEMRA